MGINQTSIRFDEATKAWLQKQANTQGRTVSNLVKYIVGQHISRAKGDDKPKAIIRKRGA